MSITKPKPAITDAQAAEAMALADAATALAGGTVDEFTRELCHRASRGEITYDEAVAINTRRILGR